jgi:hypothetical protein
MFYDKNHAAVGLLIVSIINDTKLADIQKALKLYNLLRNRSDETCKLIVQGNGEFNSPIRLTITCCLPLCFAELYLAAGASKQFMRGFHSLNHSLDEVIFIMRRHQAFSSNEVNVGYGSHGILTHENIEHDMACCWATLLVEDLQSELAESRTSALINMLHAGHEILIDDKETAITFSRDQQSGLIRCRPYQKIKAQF